MRMDGCSIEERFMARVRNSSNGCWEWTSYCHKNRYGRFSIGRREDGRVVTVLAHRWSYLHFVGPIADNLVIDHLCRNPRCVNPDHLEPISQSENVRRGNGYKANNTHCKRGHEYTASNTLIRKDGSRRCRICTRQSWREHKAQVARRAA